MQWLWEMAPSFSTLRSASVVGGGREKKSMSRAWEGKRIVGLAVVRGVLHTGQGKASIG